MSRSLADSASLLQRGLFLEPDAYDEAADDDNTFVEGLFLVLIVGIIAGVAAVVGGILDWAVTPNLTQMKDIILQGMQTMPWFRFMEQEPQAMEIFRQQYDMGWQIAQTLSPKPGTALASIILTPLGLILSWLWFSLIAQFVARLLGGNGTLGQTLGASALATAPALLNVFGFVPYVVVAAVGTLTLLARYIAIRRVHENLSWPRALVAVLAPPVILTLLLIILSIGASLLLIPIMAATFGGAA
ncbi:MAG: YIP1 family protein [Caldilineales bacterium]|nr:YIP1 family protein [Caldilineales bacterium]